MRRVYVVIHATNQTPQRGKWDGRKIKVREPRDEPTATHWVDWMNGSMSYNPDAAGELDVYDQAMAYPVKRLQ